MKKNNEKTNDKVIRRRKKMRLGLYDDNTGDGLWNITLTPRRIFLAVILAIAVLISLIMTVLTLAHSNEEPHRQETVAERPEKTNWQLASEKLDSLQVTANNTELYLANLNSIMKNGVSIDSLNKKTEPLTEVADSITAPSVGELDFIRHYEEREKYNLSVLSSLVSEAMNFTAPIANVEVLESDSPMRPRFSLMTKEAGINAIYRGTVIDTYYSPSSGYVVIISHPNDFVSRYSGMDQTYVQRGDKVNAGSRIGHVTRSENGVAPSPFNFEMWQNGVSLNPLEFVSFT